ncbi:MAG: ATP-binding protein [Campylobacter sp.]|nr:ATP-binding protein [Campylobacter sp.]
MLVEFRVKNFLSIQDEQVLSLVASNDNEHLNSTFETPNKKFRLLKSVAIYGANASGKSNIIKAIDTMSKIIKASVNTQIGIKLPVVPFLLGDNDNEPSEFEITFFIGEVRYQYGFSATQKRICDEWLLVYETHIAQTWFERHYDGNNRKYNWKFSAKLKGKKELWKDSTRENALFLSTAVQLNSEQLKPIFNYFSSSSDNLTTEKLYKDNKYRNEIVNSLKAIDLDIENIEVEEKDFFIDIDKLPNDFPIELKSFFTKNAPKKMLNTLTQHLNQNGKIVKFDLDVESGGTKHFFKIIGPLLNFLESDDFTIVDELELGFHPYLTKFVIDLFNNPKTNKNNAQLIFTTHETSVLNKDVFRKDQIYFCEKKNKATQLYSLLEFKPRKDAQNWEKSYLGGRFGAVPFFSEFEL